MVQFECPGALKSLNLIYIWGISLSLPSSLIKSEFPKRVICGNLGQCTNLPILNHEKVAQNWLSGASRVPGIILAPIPRTLEPESGGKGVCRFQVLSKMMHHVSSDLAGP